MKPTIFYLSILLTAAAPFAARADHIPTDPDGIVDIEPRVAVQLDAGRFDPLVELTGRLEEKAYQFRYRALTLGGSYRLHRNLKVGAYYRLQAGVRHDDDWIDLNPGWEWLDTRDRLEHVLILDASPRILLDFLPGKNWIGMLKTRYLFNTYNDEQSLLLRPGISWFLIRDRQPVWNFSLNYGLYLPLNFGESLLYEHTPYLAAIYHLSPILKLELSGGYRTVIWSSSRDVIDSPEAGYTATSHSLFASVGLLIRPGG
jgi:hypothetical protein